MCVYLFIHQFLHNKNSCRMEKFTMICITLKHDLYHELNAEKPSFFQEFASDCRPTRPAIH